MAKIIYGVAGEGFGHSSRSHLIGQRLIASGHDVTYIASDKSYRYLEQYFGKQVIKIRGMFFVYQQGRISPFKTFLANTWKFPGTYWNNFKLFREIIAPMQPDLVITDFEPFIATWAHRHKLPLLSVDHEHVLTKCDLDNFKCNPSAKFNSLLVTKSYRIRAAAHIVINFFKTPVTTETTYLAPPVVRPIVCQTQATQGQHIVYYSTDRTGLDMLLATLQNFPNQKFHIYGYDQHTGHGNCILKKTSTEGFIADLASSKAVIASAGFSLLSECLYFRKKMLLLPILGQYEQIVNSHYVEKLKLGYSSHTLNKEVVANFLARIDDPMEPQDQVLWPDNEKFFEVFGTVLNKMGHSISKI
ncbi:MAG: hypothetical protein JXA52_09220 [Planctomycetes bacterium]|nr:hypothetical protein [Planctomycetota bacterium]